MEEKKLFSVIGEEEEKEKPQLFSVIGEEEEKEKPQLFSVISEEEKEISDSSNLSMIGSEIWNKAEELSHVITQVNDNGILKTDGVVDMDEWRNFSLQLICKIRKILDTPDGEKAVVMYRFRIYIGREVYETIVNAGEVDKIKWVKEATEGKAILKKGGGNTTFSEYVSDILMSSTMSEQIVYSLNGWRKLGGKHLYVHANGTIGMCGANVCGNPKYRFNFESEKVGTKETFDKAIGMLEICRDKIITLPLFLMTHIGSFTTLFEEAGYPVKFTIAVIGETNSRKTSLSLCLTQTINRKKIQVPEITFESTEGGIEKAIASHPDAVLVIDDYKPASAVSKQRSLDTKLEKVQRLYGDRKGIERMTDFAKNPNAGYYPIRGVGVITGEHIKGVISSLTRSLILKINRNSVDNSKLACYQNEYMVLNNHICGFLAYASENYEDLVLLISERVCKYRAQNLFEIPRFNETYAIFMTTIDAICKYALKYGFWNQGECKTIYDSWRAIIQAAIRENESELRKRDWPSVLRQVCMSIIEDGTFPLPVVEEKNYADKVFADEEIVYIRMDIFLQKVKSSFALWGIECPNFSKQFILTELEKADLIETRGKSEGKRTLKLPGSKINQQRFLYIKRKSIKKIEER